MNRALGVLEHHYPRSAAYLVTFVGYGLPDFGRLPGGLVSCHMPRLASDVGPTDVSPAPRRQTPAVPDAIADPTDCAKTRPRQKYAKLCYAGRSTRVVAAAQLKTRPVSSVGRASPW